MIEECQPDELVDFPRRMREWLYNVMKELSERKEISYYYQKMEKEAEVRICESNRKDFTNKLFQD